MSENVDQLRRGIIMTGYRGDDSRGEVLTEHGEVLGAWHMEPDEWTFFTPEGQREAELEAPSTWLLHDRIADWYEASKKGAD